MDAAAWDDRYRGSELVWSAEPNRWVRQELTGLPPGRALDLACGEGRNALWLARNGWYVVGVDFSAVALAKAARLAAGSAATGSAATGSAADGSAADGPAARGSAAGGAAADGSAAKLPRDETPRDETPRDETPRDETPRDETPGDETPRHETDEARTIGRVHWVRADATAPVARPGSVDLVVIAYLQLVAADRRRAVRLAADALAPGGTLLVVAHDTANLADGAGGPQDPAVLFTAGDLTEDLAAAPGLVVERADRVRRPLQTADGVRHALDVLFRARREQGWERES